MKLKDSNLCIVVGDKSERTFDVTHAWRTLFVEECAKANPGRSQWKFVRPSR